MNVSIGGSQTSAASRSPAELVSVSAGLRRGLSVCIFNKCPSHAHAAGSGSLISEPLDYLCLCHPDGWEGLWRWRAIGCLRQQLLGQPGGD